MEWDLGLQGIGLLLVMSLGFGLAAQLVMWRTATHWLWAIVAAAYFVTGIVTSEVLFGWATEEDLQPNVDGLSFDEVLLFGFLSVVVIMVVAWFNRPGHSFRPPALPISASIATMKRSSLWNTTSRRRPIWRIA